MPNCLVLGMHRSGTSLVARSVNLLGWSLGDDDELIPPADDNPAGFWESSPIVSFNDLLLARLGGSWDAPPSLPDGWEHREDLPTVDEAQGLLERVFGEEDRRAWKDPRSSLLIPYWRRVVPIDHSIVVLRHPLEVAASLQARSGIDEDWAHYLWLRYVSAAVVSSDQPIIIGYERILEDPAGWLENLAAELRTEPAVDATTAFLRHADQSLRHHTQPPPASTPLGRLAVEVHEVLETRPASWPAFLAAFTRGAPEEAEVDGAAEMAAVHEALSRTRQAVTPLGPHQARTRTLHRAVERLEREAERLQLRVVDLDQQIATTQQERDRAEQRAAELARELEVEREARESAKREARTVRAQARSREETLRRRLAKSRKQAKALKRDLNRLRGRRSVRIALSLASVTRPVFRLRRGQLTPVRRSRPARGGSAATDPTGTGRVHGQVQRLIDAGAPARFGEAWRRSEAALDGREPLSGPAPLVSIIMPTHNRADIIGEAISTVLEQTHANWELIVCDDASDDMTREVVEAHQDGRIRYRLLPKGGAAAARNRGLAESRGELIAYLDSDNLWHPRFLETLVGALAANPGRWCAYSRYIDVVITGEDVKLKKFPPLPFDYDRLSERNFIDLNTVMHRRALYDELGGFNEQLSRQQDWDLILKYSFLREPLYIDQLLLLYRRNEAWDQITDRHRDDPTAPETVQAAVASYYDAGLPSVDERPLPSLAIVSWDICRNHFSKAYNLAEAMTSETSVGLVGFRFFDEPIFGPYATARPNFDTIWLDGDSFPAWSSAFAKAVAVAGSSDVIYAVKPRLPSLGVALLANYQFGRPLVLEMNDLESVVTSPRSGQAPPPPRTLDDIEPTDPDLLNPYGELWTELMEGLAARVPLRSTHNSVLDGHFGGGAFWVRNPKDERHFDPARHDRNAVRERLGFEPTDRVLLFGGMVRRHKGVFELLRLLDDDSRYRLLVVGSRTTPDLVRLREEAGDRVTFIDAVDRNEMAAINAACDAVILWLDPDVPASHYQMPFKLTDALAMRVPVIANHIGDLDDLGRDGCLRLAPFGDHQELARVLRELFSDAEATAAMTEKGRRLFLREFSYTAVRRNLSMISRIAADAPGTLDVAREFAEFFSSFYGAMESRNNAEASAG